MSESTLLRLPYILPAQAQKHVTHNEAIRALDAIVHLSVLDRHLSVPPINPQEADRYIVAGTAEGAWAGHEQEIAAYQDGAWMFYAPQAGWSAWIADEDSHCTYNGADWTLQAPNGSAGQSVILNTADNGAQTRFELATEELTLSGPHVDSTITLPDRAIVFGVSTRTTEQITGATSYNCGIANESNKFGGLLGVNSASSNAGVIGPTAFYADTAIRLSANGSDFTGGKVKIAAHYLVCSPPVS